jgi:GNAT superfamily N-acetyltransferase
MVENFQSVSAIKEQIADQGYEYFLFVNDQEDIGYFAVKEEIGRLLLSKLYITKDYRGKGYFNTMLSYIEQFAANRNLQHLYLSVNKHNDHSIAVYRKKGFVVIKEQTVDIGCGFVMDDYMMEKELFKTSI